MSFNVQLFKTNFLKMFQFNCFIISVKDLFIHQYKHCLKANKVVAI